MQQIFVSWRLQRTFRTLHLLDYDGPDPLSVEGLHGAAERDFVEAVGRDGHVTSVQVHGRVHVLVGDEARREGDRLRLDDAVVRTRQNLRIF